MNLFGERLDGTRAAEVGLAWECVEDAALLGRAQTLAARAAEAPRELAIRVKATLRRAPWQASFEAALQDELGHQVWSFGQPFFRERIATRDRAPKP
jgi:enoyl-CoA hydratase